MSKKHQVPEWKLKLKEKAKEGPARVILGKDVERFECECDPAHGCMCCEFGDWPACFDCRKRYRTGRWCYLSHKPEEKIYLCDICYEKKLPTH